MVAGKKKIKQLLQVFWVYTRAPWFVIEMGKALELRSHRRQQVETGNSPQLTCACFYFHSQEYTSPLTPAPTALCWGCLSPSCSARREESKEGGADEPASQKGEEKENEGEKEDGVGKVNIQKVRERKRSQYWNQTDFSSDRVFPVTKAGNCAKVKSSGYESLVHFKKQNLTQKGRTSWETSLKNCPTDGLRQSKTTVPPKGEVSHPLYILLSASASSSVLLQQHLLRCRHTASWICERKLTLQKMISFQTAFSLW